jgi:Ca-activated chloride channel family protein
MTSLIVFANKGMLLLLLLLIPAIVWYVLKSVKFNAAVTFSNIQGFSKVKKSYKSILRHVNFGLQMLAMVFIILVLARPQSTNQWKNVTTEGIDIVMALDISGSMLAEDFKPNRLEAAKDVAAEFINGRPDDRIGLVIFSAESFTQCPLTTDHAVLLNLFKDIKQGMIEDGTAIGLGLANAVNRLKDSKAPSKIIILLTDGINNQGSIAPVTAAEIAKVYGIRVYTIGVGTIGVAPYPVQTPFGTQYQDMEVQIDEGVLKQIAQMTGAKYFRATNNQKLKDIYKEIDKMEKSRTEVREYRKHQDEFFKYGMIAFGLLLLTFLARITVLRSIP